VAKGISKIKKVVNELVELFDENGIHIETIILYGSYASGTQNSDSDIDLIIISKDLKKYPPLERLEFLSLITWKISLPLEIIGYTPNEIKGKQGKSIFWDEIQETGQVLYKAA